MPSLSHCADLVRAHDYDRYLCTLFAPAAAREAWFALFAFDCELALIRERVSEEMIGFIRFAWWRETLDEIYEGRAVRKHPVAEALAGAIAAHRLSRAPLDALLDARQERFVDAEPFANLAAAEDYFRATAASLFALCARAAGTEPATALESLGIAWGCVAEARISGDSQMRQAARARLLQLPRLPEDFMPLRDAAEFYLKRLEKSAKTGREARMPLLITLCLKRLSRQIGLRR